MKLTELERRLLEAKNHLGHAADDAQEDFSTALAHAKIAHEQLGNLLAAAKSEGETR